MKKKIEKTTKRGMSPSGGKGKEREGPAASTLFDEEVRRVDFSMKSRKKTSESLGERRMKKGSARRGEVFALGRAVGVDRVLAR